ncbi:hypothetical protein C3747_80g99 [Trypanosoma cruzi]|uniref:Reverse transcriptase (RNA-dependent DNA polymerase)/RNase H n=1 Tax=Trypanosoma cruzi TaxID=5693 RepID=A0A2V2WS89_TRYCR|nr:hypothetical protein C3747_80g99 [Trypanosoma cruzi]
MKRLCATWAVWRSVPFPAAQKTTARRNRPAELATWSRHTPPQSGGNAFKTPSGPSRPCRHRAAGPSISSLTRCCVSGLPRRDAPQHRTTAVFVERAKALDTVDHESIILGTRRLSIRNGTERWSAAFLNSKGAVVCIDKLASSPKIPVRGAPQGAVLCPVMSIIVMKPLGVRPWHVLPNPPRIPR